MPPARHPYQQTVERVVAHMRQQLGEGLTLAEMAELACLSPFHFVRVFRSVTGLTPRDFLAALRLQEAKRLLLTTRLSVTDICFEVGYNSLGTFTTRFTRLVGVSPGEFRKTGQQVLEACLRLLRKARLDAPAQVAPGMAAGRWIAGRIEAPGAPPGLVFVALFSVAAPQGEPPACTVLADGPGPYCISVPSDGVFYVLACLVPWSDDPLGYLLPAEGTWVGASAGPVRVQNGRAAPTVDLVLRPVRPTDPPILPASVFILARRPWVVDSAAIREK